MLSKYSILRSKFILGFLALAVLIFNLIFINSSWIGIIFFGLYCVLLSDVIGYNFGFFEKRLALPFGFLFLNMLFVAMTAISIRLFIPMTNAIVIFFLLVPMLFFFLPTIKKYGTIEINKKRNNTSYFILFLFLIALIGMLYTLWSSRTNVTIINFSMGLDPYYNVFNYIACTVLGIIIISKYNLTLKLASLSAYSIILHSIRYIRYAVLPGSDNWNVLGGTWFIHDGGTIFNPFTRYPFWQAFYYLFATGDNGYLGFWGLNAFLSRVTGISQYWIDSIFVAFLASLFVPLVLFQIGKILLKNETYSLISSFLSVFVFESYIWLTIPCGNTLGILALLFSLLLWIYYLNDKVSINLALITSLAAIFAYPLTGMFAAFISLQSILIKKIGFNKKTYILTILLCLIIPVYDVGIRIYALLSTGIFPIPNLISIFDLFLKLLFFSQRTNYSQLFDIPYFVVSLLALIGIFYSRNKIKPNISWLLFTVLISLSIGATYGWIIQERILHRIESTILIWFLIIYAGIGLHIFIPVFLKSIPSLLIQIQNRSIHISSRTLLASGILLIALFPTSYQILLPTTNAHNPSVSMVNAVNYIISTEPSKNALVLADGYSLSMLSALSHGSWYNHPYGDSLKALELTKSMFYDLIFDPSNVFIIENARDTLIHYFDEEFNSTVEIKQCYLIYDEDIAKAEQWWYRSGQVDTLNRWFGSPTIFGSTRVYSVTIDKFLFQERVEDISGNHNDGIANGTLIEGVNGEAIKFVSKNDFILLPPLFLNNSFTFETWVNYHDGLPSGDYAGLFYLAGENTWMPVVLKNKEVRSVVLVAENDFKENRVNSTFDLKDAWHHIAITYDGYKLSYYLDGILIYNENQATIIRGKLVELVIGWGTPEKSRWYHLEGAIDEFRVYGRPLNASEIYYSYKNKTPQDVEGLILWYSFNLSNITILK